MFLIVSMQTLHDEIGQRDAEIQSMSIRIQVRLWYCTLSHSKMYACSISSNTRIRVSCVPRPLKLHLLSCILDL